VSRLLQPFPPLISLIGFMGAGKTTVGRILAEKLEYDFIDTDGLVVARAGRPIAEIFEEQGETAFRLLESEAIRSLTARVRAVIAAGGGAPAQESNQVFFRVHAITFHLRVSVENARDRALAMEAPARPLLMQELSAVQRLFDERQTIYESLGTPVETDGCAPGEVAENIIELLNRRPKGNRRAGGRPVNET